MTIRCDAAGAARVGRSRAAEALALFTSACPPIVILITSRFLVYSMDMPGKPSTVDEYLALLPDERRQALQAVRQVILRNLHKSYEEGIQYGMIGYYVPHSVFPAGYHCDPRQPLPFAALASQKSHMSIHLMCIYSSPEQEAWFRDAWMATGKKLDMGKSCVRFKKLDDLPLDVIGQAIKRVPAKAYIKQYQSNLSRK